MEAAYICDAIRTPFGRYGGTLASIRTDDLAAIPIKALVERNASVDWNAVDDVVYGCANQAGEDNRNVARMALLLAGLPKEVPGTTVNRLCGSSMDAIASAARAIKCGETEWRPCSIRRAGSPLCPALLSANPRARAPSGRHFDCLRPLDWRSRKRHRPRRSNRHLHYARPEP